ncbi:MAG: SDR family NAD(P)-dependent oxidoreductase [Thermogutta sp.]|nr:SDR family NAD(P)-dependent oxidoreductase [Thermogutta sp.]
MARRNLVGTRGVITGASSGIGRSLAEELIQRRCRIVAAARRAERLNELAKLAENSGAEVIPFIGDLADQEARNQLAATARERLGSLDFLVNNAGMGALGRFEDMPPERLREVMELNFFGVVELTYAVLPLLKSGNRPIIVNVSSILGHRGIPWRSYYCASKFAVQGFSESIRAELSRHGIDVLVVSPGRTETELFEGPLERGIEPAWPEPKPVSPRYVAKKIVKAMIRGKAEIIPHVWGKGMVILSRFCPRLMDWILKRYA